MQQLLLPLLLLLLLQQGGKLRDNQKMLTRSERAAGRARTKHKRMHTPFRQGSPRLESFLSGSGAVHAAH